MAIVTRTHKQLDSAEEQAVRKFFQNPALYPEKQSQDANALEDYMYRWNVVINEESLAVALEKLAEAGVIRLKSAAQVQWEQASNSLSQQTLDALERGMRECHLVTEGEQGFENKTNLLGYLQGREVTTFTITRGTEYLQGSRGVKLHWEQRPSQITNRGHIPTSEADYRFAPKTDSNHTMLSRHSHSSNPRFNGTEAREKMKRMNPQPDDPMSAHNWIWTKQAKALVGRTHSETARIQRVVDSTPGGPRAAFNAGKAEQRRIEAERARGR